MATSLNIVEDFVSQKNIAVVGVSKNKSKFGNTIYKELKNKNYKVFPVNPKFSNFGGDKCYPDLYSIPYSVDGVIINVSATQAINLVKDAKEKGIKRIWLQQGSQSEEAVNFCKNNNINCISNECILMFTEPLGFIHRAHKWIWKIAGKLPK